MGDELRRRFMRARLAAILDHELNENGSTNARSHVAIVPQMGYLVAIGDGDSLTIRLVEE
jgi:hypothetical protein